MKNKERIQKLVILALLIALAIVLQAIATFTPVSTYALPLGLIPVAVAAVLYGTFAGGLVGFLWGVYILIFDPSCSTFYNWPGNKAVLNVIYTITAVAVRGFIAGFVAGLIYKLGMRIVNVKSNKKNAAAKIAEESVVMIIASLAMVFVNALVFYSVLILLFKLNGFAKFFSVNFAIMVVLSIITAPIIARICLITEQQLNQNKTYEHKDDSQIESKVFDLDSNN